MKRAYFQTYSAARRFYAAIPRGYVAAVDPQPDGYIVRWGPSY